MYKKILISLLAVLLFSSAFIGLANAQWDFPRLDTIIFRLEYPWQTALNVAQTCGVDVYPSAIRMQELNTLKPLGWTDTASPGFHMCYIGVNCRDYAPSTSGVDYSGSPYSSGERPAGIFSFYPLNLTAFRYVLEIIVGCEKDDWITSIYGTIDVRLDTCVPPANEFWFCPTIKPYPEDWARALLLLYDIGFTNYTDGQGVIHWVMPNGQPMRLMQVLSPSPTEAPTSVLITQYHVEKWNRFFLGKPNILYWSAGGIFDDNPIGMYPEIDIAEGNRNHDMYMLCWGLSRNPDYLYYFFHPEQDMEYGSNTPGLVYRPLDKLIKALYANMYFEYLEYGYYGPGPFTIKAGTVQYTNYTFVNGTEDIWVYTWPPADVPPPAPTVPPYPIGGLPWYDDRPYPIGGHLTPNVDYKVKVFPTGSQNGIAIQFLNDIVLGPNQYLAKDYTLVTPIPINTAAELQKVCYDIEWMLYYMCPYLPIYSRNYHDLFKGGIECWVPSLGFGAATYALKWTFDSLHISGQEVGGMITWCDEGPVDRLHPWRSTSVYDAYILGRIGDGPIEVDAYTHKDMPWAAQNYQILPWTDPRSGAPGMQIIWYLHPDVTWQDGSPVTADDYIWEYDYIYKLQPGELVSTWLNYYGCVKYSTYVFGIFVNTTGIFSFYNYALSAFLPKKVWKYYTTLAAANAFHPEDTAYTAVVAPADYGPYYKQVPTCLYATGEWIFEWWDRTAGGLGEINMTRNPYYWAIDDDTLVTPGPTLPNPRQKICFCAPTEAACTYTNSSDHTTVTVSEVTKTQMLLTIVNMDTKNNVTDVWNFTLDTGLLIASGTVNLTPLGQANIWVNLPYTTAGLNGAYHGFNMGISNVYGSRIWGVWSGDSFWRGWEWDGDDWYWDGTAYSFLPGHWEFYPGFGFGVLIGDVDGSGLVNMIDLYQCALVFGATGSIGFSKADVDNNGIINMLDLYICALCFGASLPTSMGHVPESPH